MYNILVTWTKDKYFVSKIYLTYKIFNSGKSIRGYNWTSQGITSNLFKVFRSHGFVLFYYSLIFANVFTLWFESRKSLVGNLAEWKSLVDEQHWGLIGPEGGAQHSNEQHSNTATQQHSNEHPSCPKSICDAGLQELRCCATVTAVQEHWYQCIMILLLYGLLCSQHWCCSFQATTMVDANALFQLVPICNRSELILCVWSVVCTVLYFVQSVMCTALCSYALTLIVHKLHTSAHHCAQHTGRWHFRLWEGEARGGEGSGGWQPLDSTNIAKIQILILIRMMKSTSHFWLNT